MKKAEKIKRAATNLETDPFARRAGDKTKRSTKTIVANCLEYFDNVDGNAICISLAPVRDYQASDANERRRLDQLSNFVNSMPVCFCLRKSLPPDR